MQSSAQKARLHYFKNSLYFGGPVLDICWSFFRSPNVTQLLLFQHSTLTIINNYFINPTQSGVWHSKRIPGCQSQCCETFVIRGKFFGDQEHQIHRHSCRVMAWKRGGNIPHEERKERNYWANDTPVNWEYNFKCYIWTDFCKSKWMSKQICDF